MKLLALKGIKINKEIYKLIQFADVTTILMSSIEELTAANSAIQKWCDATGMRENIKKREGLAMGLYRAMNLGNTVKWAPEGKWVKALGVPIGNDLNEDAWWILWAKPYSTRNVPGPTAILALHATHE